LTELSSLLEALGRSEIQLFKPSKVLKQKTNAVNWKESLSHFSDNLDLQAAKHAQAEDLQSKNHDKKIKGSSRAPDHTKPKVRKNKKGKKESSKTTIQQNTFPFIDHPAESPPFTSVFHEKDILDEVKLLSQDPSVPTDLRNNMADYVGKFESHAVPSESHGKIFAFESTAEVDEMNELVEQLCANEKLPRGEVWAQGVKCAIQEFTKHKQNDIHCYVSACIDCGKVSYMCTD
jgi:hypothetical protein